jgi:hypothetical protein
MGYLSSINDNFLEYARMEWQVAILTNYAGQATSQHPRYKIQNRPSHPY